jgi:CheY-like chemotaxis protein
MDLRKVLLVDDEPDIRRIGQFSLTVIGKLQVVTASNGTEALEVAAREKPDAVLLDVMMPGMDGPTTLQKLRDSDLTRHIPVVFMTAKVQRAEVEKYLLLGALGVIRKPFDPMGLSQTLRDILDGKGGAP